MLDELKTIRDEIDQLDEKILTLVTERALCAQKVAKIKTTTYCPEREAKQLQHLISLNKGPLKNESVLRLYKEIISACRALQKELVISFLGPRGTFSELAAHKHFGESIQLTACESIDEIFRLTEFKKCDYAIVPVENSIEGSVSRTLDCLIYTSLQIIGEEKLRIQQNLLTKESNLSDIQFVFGHAQSLAQCQRWLKQHLPHAQRIIASSNGEGARLASETKHSAALASASAAEYFDLKVLANDIEDDSNNTTRFLILGDQDVGPSGNDKTSLVMTAPNRAGSVHELLAPFAKHKVSMTKFESRPSRVSLWEYWFFIDVQGHQLDDNISHALAEIKEKASVLKILGSYPVSG